MTCLLRVMAGVKLSCKELKLTPVLVEFCSIYGGITLVILKKGFVLRVTLALCCFAIGHESIFNSLNYIELKATDFPIHLFRSIISFY